MALSKDLLATIAYYDALGHPITSFEAWHHCVSLSRGDGQSDGASLRDVIDTLSDESISRRIGFKDGFFFVKGRESMVSDRIREEKCSSFKLKRVRRLAQLLSFVPFVRMIGVTGSLSMKRSDWESDWDFFVVLRAGRIWTGRTILTGFLHAIGKRRHGKHVRDRACLNYYVADDALEIGTKDLFSAHEYRFLIPIIGAEMFRRFEFRNRWIKSFRPNFRPTELLPLWFRPEPVAARFVRAFLERILGSDRVEFGLSSWQRKKIERNPKTRIVGGHIEATDRALIFLPKPKGPIVFEKFMETFGKLQADR